MTQQLLLSQPTFHLLQKCHFKAVPVQHVEDMLHYRSAAMLKADRDLQGADATVI